TAHVILVMLQGADEGGQLLAGLGLREVDVLRCIQLEVQEPMSALDLALERAERVALSQNCAEARPLHLLLAIAREPRSAGAQRPARAGIETGKRRDELAARLANRGRSTTRPAGRERTPRLAPEPGPRRTPTPPRRKASPPERSGAESEAGKEP